MEVADLPDLLPMQERAAVAGLSNVFPQDAYPFPREAVLRRWEEELEDPAIAAYVAVSPEERLVGFAARRADEVLHFGTALETWGSGSAPWLHDALVATFPAEYTALRLRVFVDNARARRFYEKLGWRATGVESRTSYPPHPRLVEYVLDLSATPEAAARSRASGQSPAG